jgi:hypothetical protein
MSHEMEIEDFIVDLKRKVAVVEEQNQLLREENSRLLLALDEALAIARKYRPGGPRRMSEAVGSITFGPSSAEDAMAASIVHLLERLAEVEAERDFYKAAAGKLMKPQRRRKQ